MSHNGKRRRSSPGKWLLLGTAGAAVLYAANVIAGPLEQAKRIHDRIAGVPPEEAVLLAMKTAIENDGNGIAAAEIAMQNDNFYRVTLKNWVAPWTNEAQTAFVPLNDYIATVMGLVKDEEDFRKVLYDDIIYVGNGVNPGYTNNSNAHYEALESGTDSNGQPYVYKNVLVQRVQSQVTGLPSTPGGDHATAGVMTTRAGAKAFFVAGTNRAMFRFTLMNHLCRDLEQVHDVTRIPDRIRQDVSRSPGGDARAFLNNCLGCHSGMDPLAQSFAYYNYVYTDEQEDQRDDNGYLEYTPNQVQPKYHINETTFPYGYRTPNDRWDNYWREGINANLGWDSSLPGSGNGASSMGMELAHSEAFSVCQSEKVFKAVCLREPGDAADRAQVTLMNSQFQADTYNMKTLFASAADYCKGE